MVGFAVDADGDVEMLIPQPIFECYVEKFRHRCSTTGETYGNVVATVKGSVRRMTLKNLAKYVLKKPIASVTDADIMSAINARCLLKAQIGRLIDLERRDCKSDDVALYDLILEHAKVQQRKDTTTWRYDQAHANTLDDRCCNRTRSPPRECCLFCNGEHWLNDCPTATDAQREEAVKKFRAAKEQRSGPVQSKATRYATPAGSVRINELLDVPYTPDTGADKSVVPERIMGSLLTAQSTLETTPLSTPVEAVMADGRVQLFEQETELDLKLTTVAGLVSLRSVPCWVLSGGGDEFLLGRDVLKGIGIDVEQPLAQLVGSPLPEAEPEECPLGAEFSDLNRPINSPGSLLDGAVVNGLPSEHVGTVSDLLDEFPAVWRDAVGPDPPANVEPLRVSLRVNATPYRSPARKYAPLQADFIRDYVQSLVDNELVVQNSASRWASDVVPVRKPETKDEFLLAIDYRAVNSMAVPIAGTMPSVATTTDAFNGKKFFGRVELAKGFWQLPLHEESREIFFLLSRLMVCLHLVKSPRSDGLRPCISRAKSRPN
ncbi:hypothetical protein F443_16205 [Phytophthora nicotianae P1569]|uniref:Reverse transcriptase domain-containing protein n=1 Tax=Phytophthora nicotianae P1569 TaxID=1317065 RepID=V9EG62_PHYNI|nr:hypothetical protein F443_16205 [Phytophthora nicotianae P1569]